MRNRRAACGNQIDPQPLARRVRVIFGTRDGVPVAGGTLLTAINFNNARASADMPFFNQDIFDLANALEPGPDDPQPIFGGLTYNEALAIDRNAGINRIDAAISQFQLDAVVSATDNPAWATDLIYGDHFIFGTSGLAAGPRISHRRHQLLRDSIQ